MGLLSHNDWRLRLMRGAVRGALVVGASVAPLHEAAAASVSREYEIKAAALYNMIAFTEWPATAFANAEAPLVVGVLGTGPVANLLDEFVANETWHGRRVMLRRLSTPADARSCHALYVAQSERGHWPSVAPQFARLPILTMSDAEGFAQRGGLVQFAIEENRLRLIVNLSATRRAGIAISSKVLRLAKVLEEGTP